MRYAILLTAVVAALFCAGPALAGPGTTTGGTTPPGTTSVPATVAVDPVLAKLNTLEDQLEAMTTKLNSATAKLDATTTKLDALTTKTHNIWETTHFTKGYLQNGIPTIFDMIFDACWVASEARSAARYAAYGNPDVQTILHSCT